MKERCGTNQLLKAALWYQGQGYSVIPVGQNKKPIIKWGMYQKEKASQQQIRGWWGEHPSANVGIVTGAISGLMVVDVDSQTGYDALDELIPENLITPISRTPSGGWHFYFKYQKGLVNRARVITDCDVRTDGGYIVAAPSRNEKGSYAWLEDLKISAVSPAAMPEVLFNALYNKNVVSSNRGEGNPPDNANDFNRLQVTSGDFKEGGRDQALFHLANTLVKGGMPEENIRNYLHFFACHCEPPFPKKEADEKIQSALKRQDRAEMNISEEVRDFVVTSSGFFLTSDVFNRLQVTSRPEKKAVTLELLRLHKKGI